MLFSQVKIRYFSIFKSHCQLKIAIFPRNYKIFTFFLRAILAIEMSEKTIKISTAFVPFSSNYEEK